MLIQEGKFAPAFTLMECAGEALAALRTEIQGIRYARGCIFQVALGIPITPFGAFVAQSNREALDPFLH